MTQTPDICESIRLAEDTAGPRGNKGSEGGNIETSSTSPWFHIFRGLDGVVREYLRLQSIAAAVLLCSDKLPKFLQRINTSDTTHNPNFGANSCLGGGWVTRWCFLLWLSVTESDSPWKVSEGIKSPRLLPSADPSLDNGTRGLTMGNSVQ